MEWQREQWMAERERALKRESKENFEAHAAMKELSTIDKVQSTDEIEKEIDNLLEWVGGIDLDSEEVQEYDVEAVKQGGQK